VYILDYQLSNDNPIPSYKNDILNRADFAKDLAHAITNASSESLIIGLYGAWGSGKSSIINMAVEEISTTYSDSTIIIKFNPWNFSNQNQLIQQFFKQFYLSLSASYPPDTLKKLAQKLEKYTTFFLPTLSILTVPVDSGITVGIYWKAKNFIKNALNKKGDDIKSDLESQKSDINILTNRIKKL
jgi:predicted KAP-like P-loop ATPase